jgi:imidazolonepropionase-like amidohydrolase
VAAAVGFSACLVACTPSVGPLNVHGLDAGGDGGVDASEVDRSSPPQHLVLKNGRLPGGLPVDVEVREGKIIALGKIDAADGIDLSGRFLAPAFIDSHVHLAYLPMIPEMLAGGVAAAVDLAAPEWFLSEPHGDIRLFASGPMITSPGGYPLDSWGVDGYGLGCADASSCADAVDRLKMLGAGLIKVPLTEPGLDDAAFRAVVDRAHLYGMKVAIHALTEQGAHRGAVAGADVLAHMPVELLTEETLATWANRTVISTLAAFGGPAALENTKALHDSGATVLYGTDFGNTSHAGIDPDEIAQLVAAGFDGAAILDSGTRAPAAYWHFDDLGAIEVGKAASLLVLAADPLDDPMTLTTPAEVFIRGVPVQRARP